VIYAASYWTIQISSADSESRMIRFLNTLGKDLERTGLSKVARVVDRLPSSFYDAADVAGTLYHTPQLEARLALYPGFLSLGERQEFQALGNDAAFRGLWQKQGSLMEMLRNPQVSAILKNPELLKITRAVVEPNLQDLNIFFTTGESPKFSSEKIVGRWRYDLNGAVGTLRKLQPNMTSTRMAEWKRWMAASFGNASFVATPEQEVVIKNLPSLKATPGAAPPPAQLHTWAGQWKNAGSRYDITVKVDGRTEQTAVEIQGDRLSLTLEGIAMAFLREN
jgi:hypothetical protein